MVLEPFEKRMLCQHLRAGKRACVGSQIPLEAQGADEERYQYPHLFGRGVQGETFEILVIFLLAKGRAEGAPEERLSLNSKIFRG
jgi:hypothetical protein